MRFVFPIGISSKVNVIAQLKFEHSYYNVIALHNSYNAPTIPRTKTGSTQNSVKFHRTYPKLRKSPLMTLMPELVETLRHRKTAGGVCMENMAVSKERTVIEARCDQIQWKWATTIGLLHIRMQNATQTIALFTAKSTSNLSQS